LRKRIGLALTAVMVTACLLVTACGQRPYSAYVDDTFGPLVDGKGWSATAYVPVQRDWAYERYSLELPAGAVVRLSTGEKVTVDDSPESESAQRVADAIHGPVDLTVASVGDANALRATGMNLQLATGPGAPAPDSFTAVARPPGANGGERYVLDGLLLGPESREASAAVYVLLTDDGAGGPEVVQFFVVDRHTTLIDPNAQAVAFTEKYDAPPEGPVRVHIEVIDGTPYGDSVELIR